MSENTILIDEAVDKEEQSLVTIDFHGTSLVTIKVGGEVFVAMRQVVEGMGLSWSSQLQKLNQNSGKYGCVGINTPSSGGSQETLCLPLRKLNGWLFSVNPMKVKLEIRENLIRYQEECFAALFAYWHNGIAMNSNAIPGAPTGPTLDGPITPAMQQEIKELVQAKASAFPDAVKPKVFSQVWMRLQRKFKVPRYAELPSSLFGEARDYVIAMQIRSVEAPALAAAETLALPPARTRNTLDDYKALFKNLPDSPSLWLDLMNKTYEASERFGREIEAIRDEATKPFRVGRKSMVQTYFDASMSPIYSLFTAAREDVRSTYRLTYDALEGCRDAWLLLKKG